MTVGKLEKKHIALLALAVAGVLALNFTWKSDAPAPVVAAVDSITTAEHRLGRARLIAATVPGKQEVLKKAAAELADREKGIIQADTAAQAQAQLLEIARRTARALPAPIEFGSVELGQPIANLGDAYGEVFVSVSFNTHIEDLVNYLSELSAQPELIATHDLRVTSRADKEKTIGVRLTLSGVVPRRLVPVKRGAL